LSTTETADLVAELDRLAGAFASEIAALATEQEIRLAQARYLGKKGKVSDLMKALGRLPPAARPVVGEAANRTKSAIETAVGARLAALDEAGLAADLGRSIDVTLPPRGQPLGTLHPLTLVRREIEEIFHGLGFAVRTGPWVETEWHNFDALNTPPDHPARDMQDTFFVEGGPSPGSASGATPVGGQGGAGGRILRSHTSPVQIRTMLTGPPPVRIIAPGNVFRRDDDATHTPMFPQMEGLLVDEGVSFADLKGTLLHFVHRFFGPNLGVRLRPSYFPFTEPSAEVDAACYLCQGSGQLGGGRSCKLCKGSGWIEIGGAGMVHPNVFRAVGYDPAKVSGFAFGMGLSRMAMLKFEVDDLRSFYEHDVRFLAQFR
jgi:phenylalanyl-tRNA synthetase alpha chain